MGVQKIIHLCNISESVKLGKGHSYAYPFGRPE